MHKQYFNLEISIVLIFTHRQPDGSFVYGNNQRSGIKLVQEELVEIIGIWGNMNVQCGNLPDYLEDEDKDI